MAALATIAILAQALNVLRSSVWAAAGTISTYAGLDPSGDGGPGDNAIIVTGPEGTTSDAGVDVDARGDLYVTDKDSLRTDPKNPESAVTVSGSWPSTVRRMDASSGIIDTIAGAGNDLTDGGSARTAALAAATDVAVDGSGAVDIADAAKGVIRRIDTQGIISTIAGIPDRADNCLLGLQPGLNGIPARSACLADPEGIAVDSAGNLYIAVVDGNRVDKVDPTGIITTVAGGGTCPPTASNPKYCGDGGPATSASLFFPYGVAVDRSGDLYIADAGNCVIRMVDTHQVIHTAVGTGTCGGTGDGRQATLATLHSPHGVRATGDALYIADTWNHRVRRVDLSTRVITTVVGTGVQGTSPDGLTGLDTRLSVPTKVAVGRDGRLFIADSGNDKIRVYDPATRMVTTAVGVGSRCTSRNDVAAQQSNVCHPDALTVDHTGHVDIAEEWADRVRTIDDHGHIQLVAGNGIPRTNDNHDIRNAPTTPCPTTHDGSPGPATAVCGPTGLTMDSSGALYIAGNDNLVRRIDPDGIVTTVVGTGKPMTQQSASSQPTCPPTQTGGNALQVSLCQPDAVAVWAGTLYVADRGNQQLLKIDRKGRVTVLLSAVQIGIGGLAVNNGGRVYYSDQPNNVIRMVDDNGSVTTVAGMAPGGVNELGHGQGIGDGGPATQALLSHPSQITFDPSGNLLIADTGNDRVRMVDGTGTISTIAGGGASGFCGDGGPATSACLFRPTGIAYYQGKLYIADQGNMRIRVVQL